MKDGELELHEVPDERRPLDEADGEGQIEAASQIGDRLAEIRDLLAERAKRDSQVDRLEHELRRERGREAEVQAGVKQLAEREREAKALALEVEVRTAEIEELRAALSAGRGKVESQRERLAVQTAKLEKGREEIEELRVALTLEHGKVESQRERLAVQTAKLEKGRDEAQRLRQATMTYVGALPRRRRQTALRLLAWLVRLRLRKVRTYLAIRRSGRFDAKYYLMRYPDVAATDENPIVHYIESGAIERRNPSHDFDTAAYIASRPELTDSGENPLLHQIRSHGESGTRR